MIRVHISDDRCLHATVHEQPSWFARYILRRQEQDYEVWRIREIGARFVWVDQGNHEVSKRVAAAIERAVAKRGGGRLRLVRGGR